MSRHKNIEKPTKWFLNLISDKLIRDSPLKNKIRNRYQKYDAKDNKKRNTEEHGENMKPKKNYKKIW